MKTIFLLLLLSSGMCWSQIGHVVKIAGGQDAYLIRQSGKVVLTTDLELDEGDEIFSESAVLVLYLEPSTQMSLGKHSQIRLTKNFIQDNQVETKSESLIDFLKGYIRLQVSKETNETVDQKVRAQDVVFGVRGTEFEISDAEDGVDLEVIEGEVEVESPLVTTNERFRANEGMNFSRKTKRFQRRQMKLKFRDHPGFLDRSVLRQKWKKSKEGRRERFIKKNFDRRQQRRDHRKQRKN